MLSTNQKRAIRSYWKSRGAKDATEGKQPAFFAHGQGDNVTYTYGSYSDGETGGGKTFPDRQEFDIAAKAYLAGFQK